MPVIDLKSLSVFHYSPAISQEEQFNEFRQNHFLSNYGSLAVAPVSAMCSPLPRKPQGKKFYMLRPVSLHGICPTDFPRKPSGYRSVPSCPTKQTLPHGYTGQGFSKHLSQCKQDAQLANLRRLRTAFNLHGKRTICQRRFWCRTRRDRLRTRLHNHRSQLISIPLGLFSSSQGRNKTAYTPGPSRQYSNIHSHQRRQTARRQYPRPFDPRTRQLLYHGSGLSGFCQVIPSKPVVSFFRNQSKIKLPIPQALLSPCRQEHRPEMRPNNPAERFLSIQELPGEAQTYQISRSGNRQGVGLSDKQFFTASPYHYQTLQKSLAGRIIFRMDQTKSPNQGFLRKLRECCQNSSLDCCFSLCSRSHNQKTTSCRHEPQHNSTNFQCNRFRKNSIITDDYGIKLQN